ncbi:MAG: DUF882 domain-containing protein [Polyangiaceae bacterium]|nr:DUF882 domain-containing protein [Polyangiaceae bacterium]
MARLSMVAPVLFCVALPALAAPKEGKRVAVANTAGATHQGVAKTVAKKSPAPANKAKASAKKVPVEVIPPPCFDEPVEIRRGKERARFALLDCQGNVASSALHQVSWMLRPSRGEWQVVDERLVSRLGSVAKKFRTPKAPLEFVIVSGERPASVGSKHAEAKAVDFRIEGVKNEAIAAFCKSFEETGCGYYPNSVFVHMDVRDQSHITWTDASRPGEPPQYIERNGRPVAVQEPSAESASATITSPKPFAPESDEEPREGKRIQTNEKSQGPIEIESTIDTTALIDAVSMISLDDGAYETPADDLGRRAVPRK